MALTICRTNSQVDGDRRIPIEVDGITPNSIRGSSHQDILKRQIFHGNQKVELGEFFQLSGSLDDNTIVWQGDLSCVHWLGKKMSEGCMKIESDIGRHVGSEMTGGTIVVDGDASDWVGGELRGGTIRVLGSAGHLVGAAYRGSAVGMRGGKILVNGNAGNEIGHTMRRGLIAVGGEAGDLTGFNMLAGSILVFGAAGIRVGAGMRRGTIVLNHEQAPDVLPTFRFACRSTPEIFRVIQRQLTQLEFCNASSINDASFDLYNGDLLNGGRGELFIRTSDEHSKRD